MSAVTHFPTVWLFGFFSESRSVRTDADDLIRICGTSALEAAELNALHEDYGFLRTPRPGHWARVAQEIARRDRRPDPETAVRLAA